MRAHRTAHLPAALFLATFAVGAMAKMDPALEQRYAGVYGNACQDMRALRAKIWGDEMHVEAAGKDVVAHHVRGSKTHPGVTAADFVHAFSGDVKGADSLTFVLFHNKDGLFAQIDAEPKTAALIGAAAGQKLRHCDPNRNYLPGQAPPPPLGPTDLLKDAKFKAAYFSALGPLAKERWLARLDGPAPEVKMIKTPGAEYQLVSVCKPHDCANNNLVVLWNAAAGALYGKLHQGARSTQLGNPPPQLVPEIERIWKSEWRR
jgi:hypothetical protein